MSDRSEDLREKENNSVIDSQRSILSNIIRPVFSGSNSHIAVPSSSFLTPAFIFRRKSISIINESLKGNIQLSMSWKNNNEQPLDFIPLEKVDESYYPEEIEEEVIIPYTSSNNPPAIQRNVISYSSNLAQGTEELHAMDNNVNDYKSTVDDERTRYESTTQKKSLRENTTFKEDDNQSSKREAKINKLLSNDKNSGSSSFTTTNRQSRMENYKVDIIPGDTRYTSQNRPSYEDDKSKKITPKTIIESIKHDFALLGQGTSNYRDGVLVPNMQNKSTTTDEGNKSQIHTPTSAIDRQESKDIAHNYRSHDNRYSKLPPRPPAAVNHREQKISSNIDPRKFHYVHDFLPLEDSVLSSINFKNISKPRALKKTRTKAIFDAESTPDRTDIKDEADKVVAGPTISINKLDVTVVGNSSSRSSTNTLNPLMEIAESSDEASRYSSEYELESLNKSYLWKYKVKF